jgi:hypothetical protein
MKNRNSAAIDQLPIRLIMSLAIIAAIILLIVSASGPLRTFLAEQEVESQCRLLESSLSTLAESGAFRDVDDLNGAEGTKRVQTFTLPKSLVYLSFGGDPDPSNTGLFTSELLEDGAVICYKVQGGSKQVIWLPKETHKFREGAFVDDHWVIHGDGHSFIIRTGGILTLLFERVEKNHKSYILIHTTDEMN